MLFGGGASPSAGEQNQATPAYVTYTDADSGVSFEHPAKWSVASEVDETSSAKYITVYDADGAGVAQLVLDPAPAPAAIEPVRIDLLQSTPLTIASKAPSYAVYGIYQVDEDLLPVFGISPYGASVTNGQAMQATTIEPREAGKYRTIRFEQLFDAHFHDREEAERYFQSEPAQALYKLFQSFKLG